MGALTTFSTAPVEAIPALRQIIIFDIDGNLVASHEDGLPGVITIGAHINLECLASYQEHRAALAQLEAGDFNLLAVYHRIILFGFVFQFDIELAVGNSDHVSRHQRLPPNRRKPPLRW